MGAPRLEINLSKIHDNASIMIERLALKNISVTAVMKSMVGSLEIAQTLRHAGISILGDARIENIKSLYHASDGAQFSLIRSPMLSQVEDVVLYADTSHNTEISVLRALSVAACRIGRIHNVILMVELGDMREGIMPCDMEEMVRETLTLPNIFFKGIGTNLGCSNHASPNADRMDILSALADSLDETFGFVMETVSGGNSSNMSWAFGGDKIGRINDLRLGETIILGCDPLHNIPIVGLHTDAIILIAEVIEAKVKPRGINNSDIFQALLAIGKQDTDMTGLTPPQNMTIIGASSDHMILQTQNHLLPIGSEVIFDLNYSALLRAMTSPFIEKLNI